MLELTATGRYGFRSTWLATPSQARVPAFCRAMAPCRANTAVAPRSSGLSGPEGRYIRRRRDAGHLRGPVPHCAPTWRALCRWHPTVLAMQFRSQPSRSAGTMWWSFRSVAGDAVWASEALSGAQKESRIEEGHLMPDHVHMMIAIPPKYAVSQVIGYIKGKSAIHLARVYGEPKRNFVGQ